MALGQGAEHNVLVLHHCRNPSWNVRVTRGNRVPLDGDRGAHARGIDIGDILENRQIFVFVSQDNNSIERFID